MPVKEWTTRDIPTISEMEEYLAQIRQVHEALSVPDGTPGVPESMDKLTYKEANDIEKILLSVSDTISRISLSSVQCGEIQSGGF